MKIKYIKGDLFSTEIHCIMHGCNNQGVMGAGVAKIIKEKYPEAFDLYKKQEQVLGKNIVSMFGEKLIINSIIQPRIHGKGRKVSYDAIEDCIIELETHQILRSEISFHDDIIAMPMIGAGLGGGNWEIIEKIIECNFETIQPVVYYL